MENRNDQSSRKKAKGPREWSARKTGGKKALRSREGTSELSGNESSNKAKSKRAHGTGDSESQY